MARRTGLRKPKKKRRGSVLFWLLLLSAAGYFGWWFFSTPDAVKKISSLFEGGRLMVQAEPPVRGTIFDRNYKELAVSLERVSVYVRTRELGSAEDVALQLAPVLETEEGDLLAAMKEGGLRIWLMRDISQEQEDTIRELNLPGVYLHRDYSRFYPQKTAAAHIVGFADDGIGLAGAEYYYDRLIRQVLAEDGEQVHHGTAGQHLLLTMDMKIQGLFEDLVLQLSEAHPRSTIGLYAMDSSSGAIVAAAQNPSFNPNTYRLYPQEILESLLVKPMVIPELYRRILLEAAQLKGQYDSRGSLLPWSISASTQSLGAELRMWDDLGLEVRPSEEFVIAGEMGPASSGYPAVTGHDDLNLGTVPTMLTPLNLLTGLSSLLNGGTRLTGHVAGSVVDAESGVEHEVDLPVGVAEREAVAGDVSREVARLVKTFSLPNDLGGALLEDDVIAFFGEEHGWRGAGNRVLFCAVPANGAELTMLLTMQYDGIVVESKTAKQRVKPDELISAVLPRVAVLQQVGKGLQSVAEPGQEEAGNFPASKLASLKEELQQSMKGSAGNVDIPGVMPDVVGLSLRKGLRLLQDKECRIRVYGTGKVISQEPKPGTVLANGAECVLKLKQEDVVLENLEKRAVN